MIKPLRLLAPSVVVFVPLGVLTRLVWPVIVSDDLERSAAVLAAAWALGWVFALGATVAGAFKPALKRFSGLFVLVVMGGLVTVVIGVAAVAVGNLAGNDWACYATSTVLGACALPMTLAVPGVVLDGLPAARAVGQGYRRLLVAPWWGFPLLVCGVAAVPGSVGVLFGWPWLALTGVVTTPVAALTLVTVFGSAALPMPAAAPR